MGSPKSNGAVRQPWNKGKLVGQKAPLKLKEIWAIRVRLVCRPDRGIADDGAAAKDPKAR
jgi:hypothetical protein